MMESARKKAGCQELFSMPDNTRVKIIRGERVVAPRPSRKDSLPERTACQKG